MVVPVAGVAVGVAVAAACEVDVVLAIFHLVAMLMLTNAYSIWELKSGCR